MRKRVKSHKNIHKKSQKELGKEVKQNTSRRHVYLKMEREYEWSRINHRRLLGSFEKRKHRVERREYNELLQEGLSLLQREEFVS